VLTHSLNLADAPSRLTFSPLTMIGMFRRFAPRNVHHGFIGRHAAGASLPAAGGRYKFVTA
jgi:hypothetical protein